MFETTNQILYDYIYIYNLLQFSPKSMFTHNGQIFFSWKKSSNSIFACTPIEDTPTLVATSTLFNGLLRVFHLGDQRSARESRV